MGLLFHQLPVPPFQANCTFITDQETRKTIVVDPGGDAKRILSYLDVNKLILDSVWLTHAHYDHVVGLADFPEQKETPFFVHKDDFELLAMIPNQADYFNLPVPDIKWKPTPAPGRYHIDGTDITFEVIHTPGHSKGGICLYFEKENILLTGDTLFANGGIGRTDFFFGNYSVIIKSIQYLLTLPPETKILSGHGPSSTIGRERYYHDFN